MEHKALVVLGVAALVLLTIMIIFMMFFNALIPGWLFTPKPASKQGFTPGGSLYGHPMRGRAPIQRRSTA